jgi:hypothetical protein
MKPLKSNHGFNSCSGSMSDQSPLFGDPDDAGGLAQRNPVLDEAEC